jgi:hypothetical protein
MPTPHEMTRTRTLERGVEEWSCTQCGRRLRLRRPPAFEKIVLDPGDEQAAHVGGAGGLEVRAAAASPAGLGDLPAAERRWLAEHGIAWKPDQTP